ncbi:MAG: hypothetical protein J6M20_02040 [Clostridia bacterium]|nr:hypothetical protein [Clostridia bacterium]
MARQNDQRFMKRKNAWKVIRTTLQVAVILLILFHVVKLLFFSKHYTPVDPSTYANSASMALSHSPQGGSAPEDNGFICISYNGVVSTNSLDSRVVSQRSFREQMDALHASGYVTITQQDVLDYYRNGKQLPEKAMLLIFEDGIYNTTALVQPSLEKYNYKATALTYAEELGNIHSQYITTANMKSLLENSYWELGSNGYRLAYINVYDLYNNYYGHLNTNEYVNIYRYLKRDYNHYLMDFLRDEDRLRQESEEAMRERIEWDYQQMDHIYSSELGYTPELYVLMHSNTGAFGYDPLSSAINQEMITQTFGMNFNRQGSCYNNLQASIYDLTRLQSRNYFSTNHLLMRIWDDTGHDVAFAVGDTEEAAKWFVDEGVAEYKGNKIILTTQPYARGAMTMKNLLLSDLDMTVTLQGNPVGIQSIYLRTDRKLQSGIQVSLENNQLVVREGENELFRQDLYTFDGGPFMSEEEHELEGLITLQQAIIDWDEDQQRVEEAKVELAKLKQLKVPTLEEGGKPFYPLLDLSDRDERQLRIQLVGSRLSLWLDGVQLCDRMKVSTTGRGNIAFGAEVWKESERFSQTNLYDDVYDAVFIDPVITDPQSSHSIYYQYRFTGLEALSNTLTSFMEDVVNFFATHF